MYICAFLGQRSRGIKQSIFALGESDSDFYLQIEVPVIGTSRTRAATQENIQSSNTSTDRDLSSQDTFPFIKCLGELTPTYHSILPIMIEYNAVYVCIMAQRQN